MQAAVPSSDLADSFAGILDGLCRAIAVRMARRPATIPLLMLLWTRLRRATRRFAVLVERAAAGRPPRPRAARPRTTPARRPDINLPTWFGWVCHFVPGEAACYGSQLQALISRPEMAALLAAAPQAARLLRPLCHMLAVPRPALLAPPPPPARAPPAATDPALTDPAAARPPGMAIRHPATPPWPADPPRPQPVPPDDGARPLS